MATEKTSTDSTQGLLALVGISLGLIPLIKVALGNEVGRLLSWVPGTDDAPGSWLVPVVVLVVCGVGIMALERTKSS